jgi:hypothetical protein
MTYRMSFIHKNNLLFFLHCLTLAQQLILLNNIFTKFKPRFKVIIMILIFYKKTYFIWKKFRNEMHSLFISITIFHYITYGS